MYQKYGKHILSIMALVTLILGYYITQLRFNYNFESFFPIDDPDLATYQEFRTQFENDNDYLLLGIENSGSIFEPGFLQKVDSLTHELEKMPRVERLFSPTHLKKLVKTPLGMVQVPYFHPNQPHRLTTDSLALEKERGFIQSLISEDRRSVLIIIRHTPGMQTPEAEPFIQQINQLIEKYRLDKVHIAGKIKAQGVYINKIKNELLVFFCASALLVMVILIFAYRSWWGVFMPIFIVILSVVWLLGLMGMFGKPLDVLLILLPTIMFVVGMSDVVHLLTKYIEELRGGQNKLVALKITVKEIGLATFLTSLTTALGFLTLLTASVQPIREFGVYTALGVFLAFIITYALLPTFLLMIDNPTVARRYGREKFWRSLLSWLFKLILLHPRKITGISFGVTFLAIYGIFQIEINSFLIEDIPRNDPLKIDFLYFDHQFNGSIPFEMVVQSPNGLYSYDALKEMDTIEHYLFSEMGVTGIFSPLSLIKSMNQTLNGGLPQYYRFPTEKEYRQINKYRKHIQRQGVETKVNNQKFDRGRISGKMIDIGSARSIQQRERLKQFLSVQTNHQVLTSKITGTSVLIDNNNIYLTENMIKGLGIAFSVVALIAGILFRSVRMIFITLIPNVIPLIIVAGIMGFTGIDLNLSTSIIFTIAFGIAVDDTIHLISKFKIEINKNKSLLYALKRTYFSTGKAVIVTSIILSGGFLTLILSSFGGTFYTGLLVSLTLFFALVIDLTLLPALLILFFKRF